MVIVLRNIIRVLLLMDNGSGNYTIHLNNINLYTRVNFILFFQIISCRSPNELAPGCSAVSSHDSNSLHMTLDPERDLQRIHSLIMCHLNHLETRIKLCESSVNRLSIHEDMRNCHSTMIQLREIAYQIEQKHRLYHRSIARDTKYGSK